MSRRARTAALTWLLLVLLCALLVPVFGDPNAMDLRDRASAPCAAVVVRVHDQFLTFLADGHGDFRTFSKEQSIFWAIQVKHC